MTSRARNQVHDGLPKELAKPFIGGVEKGLIPSDRASDGGSKVVPSERWQTLETVGDHRLVKIIGGIERAVPEVFEHLTVQVIGPILTYYNYLCSWRETVRSIERARHYLELLDTGDSDRRSALRHRTQAARGDHRGPIHNVNVLPHQKPVTGERTAMKPARLGGAIVMRVNADSGLHVGEVGEVAAVERQLGYPGFIHHAAELGIRRVDQRRFC